MSITKPAIVTKEDASQTQTPIANKVTAHDINELKRVADSSIDAIAVLESISSVGAEGLVVISDLAGFPDPADGVITLADKTAYWITTDVDIDGNRLVCGDTTVIFGSSSENSFLRSTGLTGAALITATTTLPMQNITLTAETALSLDATGVAHAAADWLGVNFLNCGAIGTVKNYSNTILNNCAFLNSGNLTFDGTTGTIGFSQTFFHPPASQAAVVLPATLEVTRRFRIIYSSFVLGAGAIGINVSTDATLPIDSYILDTVNFGGDGTPTVGVQGDDNRSQWINSVGVVNSNSIANLFIKNNAVATEILVQNDRYPVAGTSAVGDILQRFEHVQEENSIRFLSASARFFQIGCSFSLLGPNNAIIGVYLAIARAGAGIDPDADRISESEVYITTSGTRPESGAVQALVELGHGDRVYVIVQNSTGTGNVTMEFLNLIASLQA